MTLDALFASAATQAPTDGAMIPLEEMPLGAFKEMVERHLGRELTDDTGRDLASWLESTVPTGETPRSDTSTTMAHFLVDMARHESVAPAPADPDDAAATEAAVTLGARLSALARSIGLPIGRRGDIDPAQASAAEEATPMAAPVTPPGPEQVATRKPVMRPPLSKAQRQAVIASASGPATPLVIDLRGEDPFAVAALGGGKPSPAGATGQASPTISASDVGMTVDALPAGPDVSGTTPLAVTASTEVAPKNAVQSSVSDRVSPLEAFLAMGTTGPTTAGPAGTSPGADAPQRAVPVIANEETDPASPLQDRAATEPKIRIDLSQIRTAGGEAQPGFRIQTAATPTPSVIPPMAVERVMRIVELQATAPPPRMAVVEIPEMDGLRIMVSLTDRGAVSVTPLGSLTDPAHAPFMQTVTQALESQGFLLDERSRGRSQEQGRQPDRGRSDRDQPRRRPRPDGLFA